MTATLATTEVCPHHIARNRCRICSPKHLRPSGLAPAKPKPPIGERSIVAHVCFNQQKDDVKPRCKCGQQLRITRRRAIELVAANQADWLLMRTREGLLTTTTRAVVMRQKKTPEGEKLFALATPLNPRDAKHNAIKTKILLKARNILRKLFVSGSISHRRLRMSDATLQETLENPEPFLSEIKSYQKAFEEVSLQYWSNVLGYLRLNIGAGQYLSDAPQGCGQTLSGFGGKNTKNDKIADLSDMGEPDEDKVMGRAAGANFVSRRFNGGYIYNTGSSPHDDDDGDFDSGASENQ